MEDEVIDDDENEYQLFVDSKMDDANFVQQVSGMDPAKREAYMRNLYRSYVDESALATDELMMAKELRDREMPTGGMAGDVYVAANPLEFLAKGVGDYKSKGLRRDARADLDEQAAAKAEARGTTSELIQQGASAVQNANNAQTQQQALAQAMQNSENDKIAAALRSGQRYTR